MKKINSEIKINDEESFKIKIGTTNKKFSDSIYIEIGSYVKPLLDGDYKARMEIIYKKIKRYIMTKLSNNQLYGSNFILVDDVATERMNKGKRSYYEVQLFLKTLKLQPFKIAAGECNDNMVSDLVAFIKKTFKEENFECYKTKA